MKRLENITLDLVDISKGKRKRGRFGGNNGKKRYWEYNNVIYMIKHQDKNNTNIKFKSVRGTSIKGYNNAVLSEYIGSNLINFINFDNMFAQHTFLVKETDYDNQKETFWVACEHLDKNRDDGFEFYTLSQIDEFDYAEDNGLYSFNSELDKYEPVSEKEIKNVLIGLRDGYIVDAFEEDYKDTFDNNIKESQFYEYLKKFYDDNLNEVKTLKNWFNAKDINNHYKQIKKNLIDSKRILFCKPI